MKEISVQEVIISTLQGRGEGTLQSPMRRVVQVYSKDGDLIAENDPSPETYTEKEVLQFVKYLNSIGVPPIVHEKHFEDWLRNRK